MIALQQELLGRETQDGSKWKSAAEEGQYYAALLVADQKLYSELWKKIAWAIGTTLNSPYSRNSTISEISRTYAIAVVEWVKGPK